MPKFRKRPVVIEAVKFDGGPESATPIIDWILMNGSTARWRDSAEAYQGVNAGHTGWDEALSIDTLEGTIHASPGDWIIKGVKGEFYPCKPDIFEATYDPE